MHKAQVWSLTLHKLAVGTTFNPVTQEMEAGRPGVQDRPLLDSSQPV